MPKKLKYELEIFEEQTILVPGVAGTIGSNLSNKQADACTKKSLF